MHRFTNTAFILLSIVCIWGCTQPAADKPAESNAVKPSAKLKNIAHIDADVKVIHVFVALCDNKYQGIVPVPKAIGNGQDPETNLYWGCDNGVRSYFNKSKDWQLLDNRKQKNQLLERVIYKHRKKNVYLVGDAWDGRAIEKTTEEFLYACAGQMKDTLHYEDKVIGIGGNAQLLSYIGHDGLMNFSLIDKFDNADGKTRDCIILACTSQKYFGDFIKNAKAKPLLWTASLMCPEAYTLHDAITGYLNDESDKQIRSRAVAAYVKYQKCSQSTASNILVSGF